MQALRTGASLLAATAIGFGIATGRASAETKPVTKAVCVLQEDNGSGVSGVVHFTEVARGGPTEIQAHVRGLKPGTAHGFHVHEFGNLLQGCMTTGGHFNPNGRDHGGPNDHETKRHVGDLGNVVAGPDGTAQVRLIDPYVMLSGPNSVVGRAIIVHADEDDLGRGGHADSLKTGHAGARISCGVIGIAE